jgi:hypothetical protein
LLPVEELEPELEAELELEFLFESDAELAFDDPELESELELEFDPESVLAGLAALSLLMPVDAEPELELEF